MNAIGFKENETHKYYTASNWCLPQTKIIQDGSNFMAEIVNVI